MRKRGMITVAAVLVSLFAAAACAEDAAVPGELTLEMPTMHCLGVRWVIAGDDNRNTRVFVDYRKAGESEWRRGMALFRTTREALEDKPAEGSTLYAGSVLDLEPDTPYEMRLTLDDPDGGGRQTVLAARTAREPAAPEPLRTLYVVPGEGGGSGTEDDPFRGLAAADAAAEPGDLIIVGAGSYPAAFTVRKSGQPGRPIIWRGPARGEAVIEGSGGAETAERGISATDVHDVWLEGLTIRRVRYGIVAHRSRRIVMRRCHVREVDYGFTATNNEPLTQRFFLADNILEGPSTWPRTKGIESARGFQVSGRGHEICHNRITGFADGIDTFGSPECSAIDIYNNDISEMTDDGIEADYSRHNVRIFRNRLTNCFQGISEQPVYGGPVYIFRNVMYNIAVEPFKMHTAGQDLTSGFLLFHNTVVKKGVPWCVYTGDRVNNVVTRNNLFVGTAANYAKEFTAPMEICDFDYDAFAGGPFEKFAKWNGVQYRTFEEFKADAPIENHASRVDAKGLFASGVTAPASVETRYPVSVNDLRLASGSGAVDRGVYIPNVNDGFTGEAPDLGAYEIGAPLAHYGPR